MDGQLFAVAGLGIVAIWFAARVFLTKSMVRSALWLLGSMAALGALFLALEAEFLGVLQLMMMGSEMAIMAIFMVMFMMDPGGLGKMEMTHQRPSAIVAGALASLGAGGVGLAAAWGPLAAAAPSAAQQTRDLGLEILERSMMIFETVGVTILTAMIAATAIAIARRP